MEPPKERVSLNLPIRTFIVKVLSYDPEIFPLFGRSKEFDHFFQDLLTMGVDFYELLNLFINCDAVTRNSIAGIIDNLPKTERIKNFSEQELRKMIPHWTGSRYHTAPIEEVLREIKEHIEQQNEGAFVYNSNLNTNRKAYNDTYLLIVTEKEELFFDINRRRAFLLGDEQEDSI